MSIFPGTLAVDRFGAVYLIGRTTRPDFPITPGAFQTTPTADNNTTFVTKIAPGGTGLEYATYVRSRDANDGDVSIASIAVDASLDVFVTGTTSATALPLVGATQMAFGGQNDAYVIELNPTGTDALLSTYLGGSGAESGNALALDPSGNAYITGVTQSSDFPLVAPFQSSATDPTNNVGFVTKIEATPRLATTTQLLASTMTANGGDDITFTATVAGPTGSGTPTGSVKFLDGTSVLGTVLLDSMGIAVFDTSTLPPGTHSITAVYSGDLAFSDSNSNTVLVVVNPIARPVVSGLRFTPTEGLVFRGTVATLQDTDVVSPTAFVVSINWGDGLSSGGTVTGAGHSLIIAGSHNYAEQGSYQVNIKVTGPFAGGPAYAVSRGDVADAPLHVNALPLSVGAGQPITNRLLATFTDDDPGGTLADYTAKVDWGGGEVVSASVSKDPTVPGQFDVTASKPTPISTVGTTLFTVTVSDGGPVPQAAGTWAAAASLPAGVRLPADATGSNGLVYAIGGIRNNVSLAEVEAYDANKGTWTAARVSP